MCVVSEIKFKLYFLMLEEILVEMGVFVESVIMVGDISYDLEMVCNIVMLRIGVSYGVYIFEMFR